MYVCAGRLRTRFQEKEKTFKMECRECQATWQSSLVELADSTHRTRSGDKRVISIGLGQVLIQHDSNSMMIQ